jgi:hypothetical protein
MTEYDNTNTGALFPAENMKVVRQGRINVDGAEENFCLVQVQTKAGKTVFEMYQKVGAVFANERKRDEKDADMSGSMTVRDKEFMVWGRKRESKNGLGFTSVSVAGKKGLGGGSGNGANSQTKSHQASGGSAEEFADDIPF